MIHFRSNYRIIFVLCFLLILIFNVSGSDKKYNEVDIVSYCPASNEVAGWQSDGDPQTAKGEDLFLLINGGAEIYQEYGFREAVFQTYRTEQNQSINLEIYEMENQEAAYGIYTFKTGFDGRKIEVGHEGWLESYFLNFWKGNYCVTLIGLTADTSQTKNLIKLASKVESKMNFQSQQPAIVRFLPEENREINGITYLRGNLALFNQYVFDRKDLFGFTEGVIGKYRDYSVFLFSYNDQQESVNRYKIIKTYLSQSNQFSNFKNHDTHFEITDQQDKRLTLKHFQKYIIIVLGDKETNPNPIFNLLEQNITQENKSKN